MPMVQKNWTSYGLEDWTVNKYDDQSSPYTVMATLTFKDMSSFQTASKDGEEVFGDIPNFTDLKPTLFHGEQVGQKS
jgi:uncharacterized protein (TIGR02118 family)